MKELIEKVEQLKGCKLVSFTYRAKGTGELARHTVRMGVDYRKSCEEDILELELRLPTLSGVEKIVTEGIIASLKESVKAMDENREHVNYSKKGVYRALVPGIKINLNDNSLEIHGFQHAKKVLEEGVYKPRKSSPEVVVKGQIEKTLRKGKFRSFCLDAGTIESARINGEELIFA